jgi:mevalonate kinase
MEKIQVITPQPAILVGDYLSNFNYPNLSIALDTKSNYIYQKSSHSELKIKSDPKTINKNNLQILSRIHNYLKNVKDISGINVYLPTQYSNNLISLTVATIYAISQLFALKLTKNQIYDASLTILNEIKANPADYQSLTAVLIWGGAVYSSSPNDLPQKISLNNSCLSAIKLPDHTNNYQKQLKLKHNKFPKDLEEIFKEISGLTVSTHDYLIKNDWHSISEILNKNQKYLDRLELCDEKWHHLFVSAILSGVTGIKICNSETGQFLIYLKPQNEDNFLKTLKLNDLQVYKVTNQGVHKDPNFSGI